jgi:hypothetical protein
VDHFDYKVSQSTTLQGPAADLAVEQEQRASMKAAWHEGLNPLVGLTLTRDNKTQNYSYHTIDDQSRSSTRLAFSNNALVEATATQEASQKERVRTYQEGVLQDDTTNSAAAAQARELLDVLDELLSQDRAVRRAGLASTLQEQLAGLSHQWLLQSAPGQIAT